MINDMDTKDANDVVENDVIAFADDEARVEHVQVLPTGQVELYLWTYYPYPHYTKRLFEHGQKVPMVRTADQQATIRRRFREVFGTHDEQRGSEEVERQAGL